MSLLPQLVINSLVAASLYALVALGFNLIFSVTKFFNLAHGAVAAAGGYAVYYCAFVLQLPMPVAVVAGVAGAGCLGLMLDRVLYHPLRARKATFMVLLVASLGAFTVIQQVIAMLFSNQFRTLSPDAGAQAVYVFAGAAITQTQVIMLITAGVLALLSAAGLYGTRFGRSVRAVSDDAEVATIVGIRTERVISFVFFFGSAIAGIAGILAGFDTGVEPTMGFTLLLKGVIASIIGGIGSVFGGLLGALLLGFVENFGIWKIHAEWKDAIAFGLLIIFLIVRPRGIVSK